MRIKEQKGAYAVELMIVFPIIAVILITVDHLYMFIDRSVRNLAQEHAMAVKKIHEWNVLHENDAMKRPCLEEVFPDYVPICIDK